MKRIIVTGAKGGTGTSICQVLQDAGYAVTGVDRVAPGADGPDYIQLDLADAAGVNDVFAGADGVVHFGSVPGTDQMSVTEGFHNVAVSGFNVFQAAKNVGIRRIAWASSVETYGDYREHPELPVTENSPLTPLSIYGGSKVLLESLARDYARWYGMAIAGLRLTRIIYDNDFGRAKLKRFVDDDRLGYDLLWSYVDARDVGAACQAWLESDLPGAEIFNIGAANVHTDTPVAELLNQHGYANKPVGASYGTHETLFSSKKLASMLGWKSQYDWKQILG